MSSQHLPAAQIAALVEDIRARWAPVSSLSGPCDRGAAEASARELYLHAGMKPPQGCVWLDSPLEGLVAVSVLVHLHESVHVSVFNACGRERPDGMGEPAELLALQRSCDRAAGVVRREAWRLFPEKWRWDEWRERHVRIEPGPEALTAEQLQKGLMKTIAEKITPQCPSGVRPRVWKRRLERFRSRETSMQLVEHPQLDFHSNNCGFGTLDAGLLARREYLHRAFGVREPAGVSSLPELSRHCGWWWPLKNLVVLTERPRAIGFDDFGRLHGGEGPALAYADGQKFYRWRDMEVPPEIIEGRADITVRDIEDEWNVELRRALVELYGPERFLLDSGAVLVNEDRFGALYRKELGRDEPLVMVKVRNSTPEPDGSYREYFLRVPPDMDTAREAVAWTFGLEPSEYEPSVET